VFHYGARKVSGFFYLHCKGISMIRFITFILCVFISQLSHAQECGSYLLLKKNTTLEYSAPGEEGVRTWTVKDVKSDSSSCRATIYGKIPLFRKSYLDYEFDVLFENNIFKVSIYSMMSGTMAPDKKKKGGDNVQEDIFIEYPANMEVGQTFENIVADLNVRYLKQESKVRISIINREVVGKETVSTPTGKYECFKITSDIGAKMFGTNTMDQKTHTTEWFAPGIGIVKTQSTGGMLADMNIVMVLSTVK
jgi:hypothetical protein